ncbi:RmlC-like cupin [Atractiella rhizophila]|nr:RmlC-like cupin [Atractiella rhizophila]
MSLKFTPRPSSERGHADHGWLKTYHTFSFANYYDPRHESFGPLRVINEDRVEKGTGFGTHGHSEFHIFSYVVDGELEHKDSVGNTEILKRGDVQMTWTGTGIRHSEYNRNDKRDVHFLQIWAQPKQRRLPPSYYLRTFKDEEKTNKLVTVVATVENPTREGEGPTPILSGLKMHASILTPSSSVEHTFSEQPFKKAYVHLIQTSGYRSPRRPVPEGATKLAIKNGDNELVLEEGDGAFIDAVAVGEKLEFKNVGESNAEFVFFELEDTDAD